ncbi:MAG TPA: flippase-like domain-containing protein [Solirubrobacteraceae bacterium]|nr:flippase-like domain-containing protein [Solirubrobacteraceae bacterium]
MATHTPLPDELAPRRLARRLVAVLALLTALVLAALLAPGLGQVRDVLSRAAPGWLALAVAFELLSCVSYVLMFRPVFCRRMSWRASAEIGGAELAVGSIVPASGASGLALGAWILSRRGMPADRIARRSVAFFLIKSSVNFVAVAVIGTLMAAGLVGPHRSLLLSALPAALSVTLLAVVLAMPRIGPGRPPGPDAGRVRRAVHSARAAIIEGMGEARELVARRDAVLLAGAIGYWAWDNAVLWATYHAVGADVPLTVVLMGYLIGQLGGLLPLPGGVGGIDGGLIGTLIVYGAPAAATTAAVLAYRVILFWVPLLFGAVGFVSLRRALAEPQRADLCEPALSPP